MARLMVSELLLVLLAGVFAAVGIPWLMGLPPDWPLFVVGFMMSMAYVAMYALANLAGKRLSARWKRVTGIVAFLAVFWGPILLAGNSLRAGFLPVRTAYVYLAAPLFGLLLEVLATLLPRSGRRPGESGAEALFAYAVPMVMVRYLLVPLVGVNPVAQLVAMQCGAVYLFGRGLVRLFAPTSAEGNLEAGPLVHRPVPDRVVGLVESLSRRSARPYFTLPDGSLDEQGLSVLCAPGEAEELAGRLRAALEGQPFSVEAGQVVEGKVELVVRPAQTPRG